MRTTSRLPLPLLLALAGCFYPAERGKMMEERVDKLETDRRELAAQLTAQKERLEAQVPKLDEKVAEVGKALEKLDKAARRTGADIGVQMEQVQADLSTLRGQVEQYLHRIAELETALAAVKEAVEKAPARKPDKGDKPEVADKGDKPDGGERPDRSDKPDKPDKPKAEKPTDRKGLAEWAAQRLSDDPPAGRKAAEEWFKKHPKADNAADRAKWEAQAARLHYELGASFVAAKDWRTALSEFGEIVKSFSKTDHAPDALLKSADCFAALKMNEESRLALEEIVQTYPKSGAAAAAKQKLAELKKAPKGKK